MKYWRDSRKVEPHPVKRTEKNIEFSWPAEESLLAAFMRAWPANAFPKESEYWKAWVWFSVGGEVFHLNEEKTLVMLKDISHAVYGGTRFKLQLTVSY